MDGMEQAIAGLDAEVSGLVSGLAAIACVALTGVLVLALVAEALTATRRAGRVARLLTRVTPSGVRRAAAVLITAAASLVGPATAHADDAPVRNWLSGTTTTDTTAATATTTAPNPTIPTAPQRSTSSATEVVGTVNGPATRTDQPPESTTAPAPARDAAVVAEQSIERYVVATGDCLWAIAARRLGPGVTNSAVDAAWRSIYAANRTEIGADPNLIFPGVTLTLPPLASP